MANAIVGDDKSVGGKFQFGIWAFYNVAFLDELGLRNGGTDNFVVNFGGEIINKESGAPDQSNKAGFGNVGEIAGFDESSTVDCDDFVVGEFGTIIITAEDVFAGDIEDAGFAKV